SMKKSEINYTLGLDLGITSVGWAIVNLDDENKATHIVDTGVIITETMEDGKEGNLINTKRRNSRGIRRTIRRKQFRVKRIKDLLVDYFDIVSMEDIYLKQNSSVYELKVKGLREKLMKEELVKVLIHYGKHRGFKSNRKHEASGEDGVILKAIKANENKFDGFISEYIVTKLDGKNKIKNEADYNFSFSRQKIQEEIEFLLGKQIELGLIDEEFKTKYLEIWESQRDFSEGPGGDSEYKVDFAKVFGYCHFDGELRAPHYSISQEINSGLSKLINLRYKVEGEDKDYQKLSVEQIQKIMELSNTKKEIKYADISKIVGKTKLSVYKGLNLSREEFIKIVNEVKEEEKIEGNLDYHNSLSFKIKKAAVLNKKVLFKREANQILRKVFKENLTVEKYDELPIEFKDDIITGLTFYKTDEKIALYFSGSAEDMTVTSCDWDLYPEIRDNIIPLIPGSKFKESASLSLNILRQLNEIMITGLEYSEAMQELGYDHSQLGINKELEKRKKLGDVIQILNTQYPNEISNPRVIRILKNCQNLIDACIDKYGTPSFINIEVARGINLKGNKRRDLLNEQLSNLDRNERLKSQILEENPNMNYSNISKYDLEKYKLYEEQDGICPYSLEKIEKGNILTNMYQIDHIVPYSKSKLNTLVNKTLVKKEENHQKGDKVPLEFLNDKQKDKFKDYINNNRKISNNKKTLYLLKTLNDFEESFTSGAIEDTRFITKYLKKILDDNLIFKGEENTVKVRSFKAGYVNQFKKINRINNFTHSYESLDYKRKERILYTGENVDLKNQKLEFIFKSQQKEYVIKLALIKETEKTPVEIKRRNSALINILSNIEKIDFTVFLDLPFMNFIEEDKAILEQVKKLDIPKNLKEDIELILTYVKAQVEKERIKKNRNNHLHHA
ncbi:MAG: type II CRISPR RNA-guided endonuclease Cas9, partial [Mycoplasmatales bacterium]